MGSAVLAIGGGSQVPVGAVGSGAEGWCLHSAVLGPREEPQGAQDRWLGLCDTEGWEQ